MEHRVSPPSKEEVALLPIYQQLPLDRIHLVRSTEQTTFALQKLSAAHFIGFDTETKPRFTKDARDDGPHIVQLATLEHAFIIQVNSSPLVAFVRRILESREIVKVGFGLNSDRSALLRKFGIRLNSTVELSQVVRKLGYRQAVGVKAAVAIVLAQQLPKSRSTTTSNWALPKLRPSQIRYAADDAHAALAVFHAMKLGMAPEAPDRNPSRDKP